MERGLVSTPKMEYQVLSCIFHWSLAMATLGLKEMGKFLWEGREKSLPSWLSQFSFAEFFWKMQRKTWYSILGVDTMPLSLKNLLLNGILLLLSPQIFRHSYDHVDQELSKREWISLSSDITFFQRWVTTWVKVR